MPKTRRRPYLPFGCVAPPLLLGLALTVYLLVPWFATLTYGPPSEGLSGLQRLQYSALLLWYDGQVIRPADFSAAGQDFSVAPGEGTASVAQRLEQAGLIRNAD